MIDLIDDRAARVLFENFIFAGDATGAPFRRRALRRGAARRRRARALRPRRHDDGQGRIDRARAARGGRHGPRVSPAVGVPAVELVRLRHRDHRKVLAVDGEVGIVGGLCISDNWSPSRAGRARAGAIPGCWCTARWWAISSRPSRRCGGAPTKSVRQRGTRAVASRVARGVGRRRRARQGAHVSALYHWLAGAGPPERSRSPTPISSPRRAS